MDSKVSSDHPKHDQTFFSWVLASHCTMWESILSFYFYSLSNTMGFEWQSGEYSISKKTLTSSVFFYSIISPQVRPYNFLPGSFLWSLVTLTSVSIFLLQIFLFYVLLFFIAMYYFESFIVQHKLQVTIPNIGILDLNQQNRFNL